MDKELIDSLWRWFYNNEQKIIYCIDNEIVEEQQEIVRNIDNLVLDLGRFSWEIAPGNNKPWSFTISPNGDKELLKQTKAIIKEAPELKSWEFNYCKPAKNWDRKFSLYDENVNVLQVDASSWNYIVIPMSEVKFEIIIEARNIKHLDAETAKNAANLVVLNEIGEEAKIQHVSVVNIVSKLENKYASQKTD
ncbi:MAG: hypothetical protein P1P88_05435, partial [Bacteroidales bacterium]|nr:hypothetical protein [Bacteroidales bacterium]